LLAAQQRPFGGIDPGFLGGCLAIRARLGSYGRSSPLEPSEPLKVIDKIGHADLDRGSADADGSHDEPHAVLLPSGHMLDMSAVSGLPGVGLGGPLGHGPPRLAPLVDMALEHAGGEERFVLLRSVSGIRPNARAGIAIADKVGQPRSVIGVGTPSTNQTVGLVSGDVVFEAEHRDGEIDGLCGLGIAPSWTLALLYLIDQRASRSFCRALASFQSSGTRPFLMAVFSASVLRCLGAGTTVASMIYPPIAR